MHSVDAIELPESQKHGASENDDDGDAAHGNPRLRQAHSAPASTEQ